MLGYVVRRILATIPVVSIVAILAFLLLRLTTGDPAAIIAGDSATTQQVAEIRVKLGLERPLVEQFVIWIGRVVRGDFGRVLLLQKDGGRADPRPAGAHGRPRRVHHATRRPPRRAPGRPRRRAARDVDRPGGDGLLGPGLLRSRVRDRLRSHLPLRCRARVAARSGLPAARRRLLGFHRAPHLAELDSGRDLRCPHRAHHASERPRGAGRRSRAHGPRQGPGQHDRPPSPRVAQRGRAHRHRDRPWRRPLDRRGGGDGERVRHSWPGAAHGGRGARPRLPDRAGGDPALLRGLRDDQPARGPDLHLPRSEDPLLKSAFNRSVVIGSAILAAIFVIGLAAPYLGTRDPAQIDPISRNKRPGAVRILTGADGRQVSTTYWMGTDSLGRDIYSRVLFGARVSLLVGISVALISMAAGLAIGLLAGYLRWLDGFVMRIMDGLMAVPAILLAIALVSLSTAGLRAVILAIVIPEVPRVVRLVRSVVLSIREEPYVEAARALGARTVPLLARHVLPNALAPLIVQATYVCASAIVIEAILSFLGVGIPPQTPTWGNIMAEGRALFRVFPHNILFPSIFLAATVLAVNIMGDGLRDSLDPRLRNRL